MTTLIVDIAAPQQESFAADVAAAWRACTPQVEHVTLSDGNYSFQALLPRAPDITYLAARDYSGHGALAEALTAVTTRRLVLATARGGQEPDAGADLLAHLAAGTGDEPDQARAVLASGTVEAVADVLASARSAVRNVDLLGAVDRPVPVLGLDGLAASWTWPGGTAQAQRVESRLGELSDRLRRAAALLDPPTLGARARPSAVPGSGSGGGLGHAVLLLGGRLRPAVDVVAGAMDLGQRVAGAHVVVAVVQELDAAAMSEGLVPLLAAEAGRYATAMVVVTRRSCAGRREWSAMGVSAVYEVGPGDVARIARTWRF